MDFVFIKMEQNGFRYFSSYVATASVKILKNIQAFQFQLEKFKTFFLCLTT